MPFEVTFGIASKIGNLLLDGNTRFLVTLFANAGAEFALHFIGLWIFMHLRRRERERLESEKAAKGGSTVAAQGRCTAGMSNGLLLNPTTQAAGDLLTWKFYGNCAEWTCLLTAFVIVICFHTSAGRVRSVSRDQTGIIELSGLTGRMGVMIAAEFLTDIVTFVSDRMVGIQVEHLPRLNWLNHALVSGLSFGGWCAYLLSIRL